MLLLLSPPLLALQVLVLSDASMSDEDKAAVCEFVAEADKRLVDRADEFLQLLNVAAQIQKRLSKR